MKVLFSYIFTALLIFACTPVYAQVIEGTSGRQIETRRNYIKDGSAEAYTRGFVRYQDAAASEAVDGVGGTPTVALPTVTTSTPIRDKKSFLITKAASNVQGQGYSIPFTIDRGDRAKVLDVEIDYTIPSGTFVAGTATTDSDLVVQIYDVTNSRLIPLSSKRFLYNGSALEDKFKASFQSSPDSTSYRLIIHHATTSSSAFTFEFELGVYPSRYVYGTPITDWQPFIPTGDFTTNTVYEGRWRRVGQNAEIIYGVSFTGTPNAIAEFQINMPAGLSIDYARAPNVVGLGKLLDFSSSTNYGLDVWVTLANKLLPVLRTTGGTFSTVSGTDEILPITLAVNDQYVFTVSVPVVGWSSSVQMSDQSDTRVVAASFSGSTTTITSASNVITPTTTLFDTHGAFSGNTYTVPVSGYYEVKVTASGSSVLYSAGQAFAVYVRHNGTDYLVGVDRVAANINSPFGSSGSFIIPCNVGDTISFKAFSSVTTNLSGTEGFKGSIQRVSGPSAIAANETVAIKYTNTAGTSIPAGLPGSTSTSYATKVYDTHNAWNGTTFTAPIPGKYRITVATYYASTAWTVTNKTTIIYKNGSLFEFMVVNTNSSSYTGNFGMNGSTEIDLVAGDTIAIGQRHNEAGAKSFDTTAGTNFVTITRIGN